MYVLITSTTSAVFPDAHYDILSLLMYADGAAWHYEMCLN